MSAQDFPANTGGGLFYRALLCGRRDARKEAQGVPTRKVGLEGLDFDDYSSPIHDAHYRTITNAEWRKLEILRWVITFAVGLVVALVATLLIFSVKALTRLRFNAVYGLVEMERLGELAPGLSFLVFWLIGLAYVLLAALPVIFIEPAASGSGVAELKMQLNGVNIPRFLRLKTLMTRIWGNIFSVSSGLPAGYEGPMLSIGGGIGAGLSQGKSETMGFDTSFTVYSAFRNDREKRDFVVCGAVSSSSVHGGEHKKSAVQCGRAFGARCERGEALASGGSLPRNTFAAA